MRPNNGRRVLILVENLPSPFDRRVWQEATTLRAAGYQVTIICPTGRGYEKLEENIGGIFIYRYNLPIEASGVIGYMLEYSLALYHTFRLTWKIKRKHGFDIIHACNPPDLFFLVGWVYKLVFGTRYLFDHHDVNPELYEAKFGKRNILYRLMIILERISFMAADISIATNDSYKDIAITRGRMQPKDVYVVRSGPQIERMKKGPPDEKLKCGRRYLVGYVGVIGAQEGIDLLLLAVKHITHVVGRKDIHFGIVGGGTSLLAMKKLASDLRIADFVTFTGRVPDCDLMSMLNTSDICVNSDIANAMNDLSTMNKIMEYMALQKPIVQFDLVEGRISAGDASLYAKRNDPIDFACKMLALLDNEETRVKMGQIGRERVLTQLEWKYEAPKLLAAYDALFYK